LFFAGIRPAINVGISVSRVGGNAQTKATKSVSGSLRLDLAAFRELEAFAQMGTELDKATQSQLDRGYRMVELLKQPQFNPMSMADQVVSLYAGTKGFFDTIPINQVQQAESEMLQFIHDQYPEITDKITETGKLEDDTIAQLKTVLKTFVDQYLRKNP